MRNLVLVCSLLLVFGCGDDSDPSQMNVGGVAGSGGAAGQGGGEAGSAGEGGGEAGGAGQGGEAVAQVRARLVAQAGGGRQCRSGRRPFVFARMRYHSVGNGRGRRTPRRWDCSVRTMGCLLRGGCCSSA